MYELFNTNEHQWRFENFSKAAGKEQSMVKLTGLSWRDLFE